MAKADDSKERAGLLFHMVSESDLEPGDHIYVWRAGGLYAHHGIYIGKQGMEVIHFYGNKVTGIEGIRIQSCTLKEFKGGALFINLVPYGASRIASFFKRPVTYNCNRSRPAKTVVETAVYLLEHPDDFGEYNVILNNCEAFAIYCKTGKVKNVLPFTSKPVTRDGSNIELGECQRIVHT